VVKSISLATVVLTTRSASMELLRSTNEESEMEIMRTKFNADCVWDVACVWIVLHVN